MTRDAEVQAASESTPPRDGGFTLIEVVWALFLLGIIAMASLGLFLKGMTSVAHVQRQQAAVSLANSAMDTARAVSGGAVNATGTSGLIRGRAQAAVTTVWNAAATERASDTSDMTMTWDPASGLTTADQWVPVQSTATVDNQDFTIDTLVGKCYRLKAASTTSGNCVATNPAPAAGTYMETYRVRVVVRWDESSDGSREYSYRLSTLVDPTKDATWNTSLFPYAYDDEFTVNAGDPASFHLIVANDTVDFNPAGPDIPIIITSSPSKGSVATNTAKGYNGVDFTPPGDVSGTVTFQYKVKNSAGQQSTDPATVTVHILPKPVVDNIGLATGTTTSLNTEMLLNDAGVTNTQPATRKTTIVPVWDPSVDMFATEDVTQAMLDARTADAANLAAAGITQLSDGTIEFAAGATPGTTSFYYYLVDDPVSTGLRFPSATLARVTLTTENAPAGKNFTRTFPATAADTNQVIDWRTETGNPTGTKVKVTGITGPPNNTTAAGRVKIDGSAALNATGTALTFVTNNVIGNYTISYQTVSPSGKVFSPTYTISVSVTPVGLNILQSNTVSYTKVNGSSGNTRVYTIVPDPTGTSNDFIPNTTTGIGIRDVTLAAGNTQCSAVTQPTVAKPLEFTVTFTATSGTVKCSLTYKVTSTGTGTYFTPPVVSAATHTMVVVR